MTLRRDLGDGFEVVGGVLFDRVLGYGYSVKDGSTVVVDMEMPPTHAPKERYHRRVELLAALTAGRALAGAE